MKVYVVFGTTGEFSDRSEWPVKAFFSEEKAKKLVTDANAYALEHGLHSSGMTISQHYTKEVTAICAANPFDPKMSVDYTGTDYSYYEVLLDDSDGQTEKGR